MFKFFCEKKIDEPLRTGQRLGRRAKTEGLAREAILLTSHSEAEAILNGIKEFLTSVERAEGEHDCEGAILIARFAPLAEDSELCKLFSVSQSELSVFRELEAAGPSTVSKLKNTGHSDSKLYEILSSLVKKKFVSCTPFRPMEYRAKPLLQALKDRACQLDRISKENMNARRYLLGLD